MTLIGRNKEHEIMEDILDSPKSEMLAVYGRRRVGKTYLIQQVYKDHIILECSGLNEGSLKSQLQNFWNAMLRSFKGITAFNPPQTWLQAFEILGHKIEEIKNRKKKVIFLDELPWFDTPKSGFMSALANFWNTWGMKKSDLIVVLCGSAASWMINNIIHNKGGLHNRVTRKIRLLPFNLEETRDYLMQQRVQLLEYDIIQLYMAIGGIPYYLNFVRPGKSVAQIIEMLFFDAQAPLRDEFDILYASLFAHHQYHVKIIKALASKRQGLTRNQLLAELDEVSSGSFTKVLNELEASGFILSLPPFLNKKKEVLYRLSDELSLFHLSFLSHHRFSTTWQSLSGQQRYKIWCGLAFESICFKHVDQLKRALGISGIESTVSSFIKSGKTGQEGLQIDLLIDRSDRCINLCEMKFYNGQFEFTAMEAAAWKRKIEVFRTYTGTSKNLFLTMVTTYGIKENAHSLSVVSNSIEMNALFQ
jgi:predicted AAA+ superfamily ATPase